MLLRLDSFEIIPEYSKYKGKYLVREGEEKMTKTRKGKKRFSPLTHSEKSKDKGKYLICREEEKMGKK